MERPMSEPKTLLQLSGANLEPAKLVDACLIVIDIQNEYLEGPLALPDATTAIAHASALLSKAREAGSSIIHIAHKGRAGGVFDRDAERGQIVDQLKPAPNEPVVEKGLPNAFAGTDLQSLLTENGCKELILLGFMTHMCVSSTARAALDLGLRVTIDAESCATRDLPDGKGGKIEASIVNEVALVELSDRFAVIAREHNWH